MKRLLLAGLLFATLIGCRAIEEQDSYRPLRENGPQLPFDQLATRARRQADLALEASYDNNWADVQDVATALAQTAGKIPQAADTPEPRKAELRTLTAELIRDAGKLNDMAKEVVNLTGEEKEKKVKELNGLLISINRGVRKIRPAN